MLFNSFGINPFLFEADTGDGGGSGGDGGDGQPPAGDPPQAGGQSSDDQQGGQPGPVPYDRFQQVTQERKELKVRLGQLEKAEKERADTEAKEQGKWQDLYNQREADLKTERLERLRLEVAIAKELPAGMAERLKGDDREALEKDADGLLAFVKPSEGPGVPPAGGRQQPNLQNLANMSPEEVRKQKATLLKEAK